MKRVQSGRQKRGRLGSIEREREADTGRGNRCNSEPGDMTYGQTVRTLMGLNRGASEKERFISR